MIYFTFIKFDDYFDKLIGMISICMNTIPIPMLWLLCSQNQNVRHSDQSYCLGERNWNYILYDLQNVQCLQLMHKSEHNQIESFSLIISRIVSKFRAFYELKLDNWLIRNSSFFRKLEENLFPYNTTESILFSISRVSSKCRAFNELQLDDFKLAQISVVFQKLGDYRFPVKS